MKLVLYLRKLFNRMEHSLQSATAQPQVVQQMKFIRRQLYQWIFELLSEALHPNATDQSLMNAFQILKIVLKFSFLDDLFPMNTKQSTAATAAASSSFAPTSTSPDLSATAQENRIRLACFVEMLMHHLNNSWDVIRMNGFEIVSDIFSWSFEKGFQPLTPVQQEQFLHNALELIASIRSREADGGIKTVQLLHRH